MVVIFSSRELEFVERWRDKMKPPDIDLGEAMSVVLMSSQRQLVTIIVILTILKYSLEDNSKI